MWVYKGRQPTTSTLGVTKDVQSLSLSSRASNKFRCTSRVSSTVSPQHKTRRFRCPSYKHFTSCPAPVWRRSIRNPKCKQNSSLALLLSQKMGLPKSWRKFVTCTVKIIIFDIKLDMANCPSNKNEFFFIGIQQIRGQVWFADEKSNALLHLFAEK